MVDLRIAVFMKREQRHAGRTCELIEYSYLDPDVIVITYSVGQYAPNDFNKNKVLGEIETRAAIYCKKTRTNRVISGELLNVLSNNSL